MPPTTGYAGYPAMPAPPRPSAGAAPSGELSAYDAEYFRRMDAYLAEVTLGEQQAAGWEREKFRLQREDAERALVNARELAQLSAKTSRYGVDVASRDRQRELEQNMRQFEMNHGLELKKFGLDEKRVGLQHAQTATDYMASPDRWAQGANYLALSSRVLAGQGGAGTYGTAVAPRSNTESDFAVLASGGNPNATRGSAATAATSGGGAGSDARVKAITDLLKASPPSQTLGLDENDFAVLNASRAIMNLNLTPQQQASIDSNPEYRAILGSNLRNLGQNPDSWFKRQQQSGIGYGSARSA